MLVDERLMSAGTALASSGIAFALRYIRAAIEGGVELGFYPATQEIVVHTGERGCRPFAGKNKSNPEMEIDKVTTPRHHDQGIERNGTPWFHIFRHPGLKG